MDTRSSQATAREFLVANTFLGSLPDDVIEQLTTRGRSKVFTKGDCIFDRDDPGDSLLVILSGALKICNISLDGRESVLNFLRTGDIIGEIAALDGGTRTARAIALEDSEVFIINRDDVIPVLRAHPDALFEIIEVLCEKLRGTSEVIENQARSMPVRFAVGLRRLAYLHGRRTASGIAVDLGASQTDLGSYLGMSRENTSRQISKFRAEGILELDAGVLTIRDDAALRRLTKTTE